MKTVRTGNVGKLILRLVEKDGAFTGLIIGEDGGRKSLIEGDVGDDVWRRLHDEAGKSNPKYFGFDGARTRFLRFFPNGFESEGFAGEERNYKLAVKSKLDTTVPLTEAVGGTGLGERVLSVFRAANLLSHHEKTRLQELFRGHSSDAFIRAAARFTMGERSALGEMESALKPHNSAKWTVVTYLPFLWRPESHMYLKPEVTRDFAARVGHRFAFDYEPRLDIPVYDSLLDLATKTSNELAELRPRDRIDVQSFIWVVSSYKEGEQTPKN